MFAQKNRVCKQAIGEINKKGKNFYSTFFLIKKYSNQTQTARFSVIISKKIAATATSRNRQKRQVRAVVQQNHLHFPVGFDYLIYIKQNLIGKSFSEIKNDILSIAINTN